MTYRLQWEAPERVLEFGRLMYDQHVAGSINWWPGQGESWRSAEEGPKLQQVEAGVVHLLYELQSQWVFNLFSLNTEGIDPTVLRIAAYVGHGILLVENHSMSVMQVANGVATSSDSTHLLYLRRTILRLALRRLLTASTLHSCYQTIGLGDGYVAFFTGDHEAGPIVVTDDDLKKGDFRKFSQPRSVPRPRPSMVEQGSVILVPGLRRSEAARNQREYRTLLDFADLLIRENRIGDAAHAIHHYEGKPPWAGPVLVLSHLLKHCRGAQQAVQVNHLLDEFVPAECPLSVFAWLLKLRCAMAVRFADVVGVKRTHDQRIKLQPETEDDDLTMT